MDKIKETSNLTFDIKYADGEKKEVETGILMEVEENGRNLICHMGTSKAIHIFSFILALEEMVHKSGLDELFKQYRREHEADCGNLSDDKRYM